MWRQCALVQTVKTMYEILFIRLKYLIPFRLKIVYWTIRFEKYDKIKSHSYYLRSISISHTLFRNDKLGDADVLFFSVMLDVLPLPVLFLLSFSELPYLTFVTVYKNLSLLNSYCVSLDVFVLVNRKYQKKISITVSENQIWHNLYANFFQDPCDFWMGWHGHPRSIIQDVQGLQRPAAGLVQLQLLHEKGVRHYQGHVDDHDLEIGG